MFDSRHRNRKLQFRVSSADKDRVYKITREMGYETISQFLVAQVSKCETTRIPESQGAIKKVIPKPVAMTALVACTLEAEIRERVAHIVFKHTGDRTLRRQLNAETEEAHAAAGWFADVLEGIRHREFILESGVRQPRHRTKDQPADAETDSPDQSKKSP